MTDVMHSVSPEQVSAQTMAAAAQGVVPDVHPDDLLWHFVATHAFFPTATDAAHYYFEDGARSARILAGIVRQHLGDRPVDLLEFASGYGMVTRHLRGALPSARVTSCDIHPAAVDFVERRLGVPAVVSAHRPEDLHLARRFDVVFALSFFSHMPERSFGRWLTALHNVVAPGGILVFTTHGLASAPALGNPVIPESGIWFRPDSEQMDLDGAEYGSTLTTPSFVVRSVHTATRAPLADYQPALWWEHQDLWVVDGPAAACAV